MTQTSPKNFCSEFMIVQSLYKLMITGPENWDSLLANVIRLDGL
jgi:hypothetical protein